MAEGEKESEGFESKEEKDCWPDDGYVLIAYWGGGYTICITFQHYHSKKKSSVNIQSLPSLLSLPPIVIGKTLRKSGNHPLAGSFARSEEIRSECTILRV